MADIPGGTDATVVPCVMGPTASGKTALAVALARRFPVTVISVDSVMVYRGLDIGSAKPDADTLAIAPHRLIDLLDPAESYSAARFAEDARRAVAETRAAGRLPLLVGGTMLYFRALQQGLSLLPESDPQLRTRLLDEYRRHGGEALHARLAAVDPRAAARIHPNDPQRILRALEVFELSGRPLSALQSLPSLTEDRPGTRAPAESRWLNIALTAGERPDERGALHARIERRFHEMLEQGLVAEVERLRRRPDLHAGLPALRAVGYRQVWRHLEGLTDHAGMVQEALAATRQYAKRQFTWLRGLERGPHPPALSLSDMGGPASLDRVIGLLRGHRVLV